MSQSFLYAGFCNFPESLSFGTEMELCRDLCKYRSSFKQKKIMISEIKTKKISMKITEVIVEWSMKYFTRVLV